MDNFKRGRPKRSLSSQGQISNVPFVEDFLLPNDEIFVDFHPQSRILVGFRKVNGESRKVLQCPFAPTRKEIDYHNLILQYQSTINDVFENSDSLAVYPSTKIFSAAMDVANSEGCKNLHDFVCTKIRVLTQTIPVDMQNFTSSQEIGEYWQMITSKVNLISTSWAPLCLKEKGLPSFHDVFHESLASVFESNVELFKKLSKIIVDAYSEARETRDISVVEQSFRFAGKNTLFDKIFLPTLFHSIRDYLDPILVEYFNHPLHDYLQKAIELKEEEKKLIKPLVSHNALEKLERKINKLIFFNNDRFRQICSKGLAPLIQQKDSASVKICTDLARSTDTITQFTRELSFEFEAEAEKCFKTENPIKAILKLYLSLAEFDDFFNTDHARVLRSNFEKGFNTSPDTAARFLAEEVHREFLSKDTTDEKIDQLVAVFRMLASKDVFGVAHHILLSRRILMMKRHIVDADEKFIDALREQCGPEYTKNFDTVFEDLHRSLETFSSFSKERNPPPYFHAIVMSKNSYKTESPVPIIPLPEIKSLLDGYSEYFREAHGKRKLEWNFKFTRVSLNAINLPGVKTIQCSGVYATLLMMLNNHHVLSPEELKKVGFTDELIEESIKMLKCKKCGRLILVMHNKIRINPEAEAHKDGLISIPFIFPGVPKTDNDTQKSAILSNREQQFDAAVMRVMKVQRSMEKNDLKHTVREMLNFRLEDELFEKRLSSLSKSLYLKLDPSGRVHYLP